MFLGGFRNIKVVYVWNIMNLELDETFSIMTRIMRLNASARRQREEKWRLRLRFFKMTNYRAVGWGHFFFNLEIGPAKKKLG